MFGECGLHQLAACGGAAQFRAPADVLWTFSGEVAEEGVVESVGVRDAKRRFWELAGRAGRGERIQIARRGPAVAVLGRAGGGFGGSPGEAAAHIRELRRGNRLGGSGIRELIEEGR